MAAHLRTGRLGERAARAHLEGIGLKFLAANARLRRGEIDLVFREGDCLVFVEVKTRAVGSLLRPAAAVDARKRLALAHAALDYLRLLGNPKVAFRFDIVEVRLDAERVCEVSHWPNAFVLPGRLRYAR